MFKKLLSLALCLMLVLGLVAVSASAATTDVADNAADTPVELGADAGADTSAGGQKIYFDASDSGWNNYAYVMVYVYSPSEDEELIGWASSKKGKMTDEGNGLYSYDFAAKGIEFAAGAQYCIIFLSDAQAQTHDLLISSECFGDTAYCDPSVGPIENPANSEKSSVCARWKNHTNLGPMKTVTSIGNVVGEVIPAHTSAKQMFVTFLQKTLNNARTYSGKDDQHLIDDTATALGIGQDDIEACITESGVDGIAWTKAASEAPSESDSDIDDKGGSGSGSGSGGGSGSGNGGGSGSGSGGGSGSGSGGGSGSGSDTKTGPDNTVLYIMLGVMVAAAGVIFVLRRKERA